MTFKYRIVDVTVLGEIFVYVCFCVYLHYTIYYIYYIVSLLLVASIDGL